MKPHTSRGTFRGRCLEMAIADLTQCSAAVNSADRVPCVRARGARFFVRELVRQRRIQLRVEIPQHARTPFALFQSCGPLLAEANFVQPVAGSNRGDQYGERQDGQHGRTLLEDAFGDAKNVGSQPAESSVISMYQALPGAQS